MASFVIHHISGEAFLNELEKEGVVLSDTEKKQFLLGNLIVDSSRIRKQLPENLSLEEQRAFKKKLRDEVQEEKKSTHFRDEDDYKLCIQAPNLSSFIEKYQDLITKDYTALGYLYHLYVDKMFFNDLFRDTFVCLDKDGNETKYIADLVSMQVKKSGEVSPVEDFWSHDSSVSIYHDYTVMNKLLLEKYGTCFDAEKLLENHDTIFVNPGIYEVDYQNVTSVVSKTAAYIGESYQVEDNSLYVFDQSKVESFIEQVAKGFLSSYPEVVPSKLDVKENRKC